MRASEQPGSCRILLYSHDSYGLGHFRRTATLAHSLVSSIPGCAVLCITGAPRPDLFRLPTGADYVKLPSFTRNQLGEYSPRRLALSLRDTVLLRQGIIASTWRCFRPHVVLVDHSSTGLLGELRQSLEAAQSLDPPAHVILGMRDIIDSPERTRAQFLQENTAEVLRDYYDEIIVYGHRNVLDVNLEYALPVEFAAKILYAGIVCSGPDVPEGASESRPDSEQPSILVSVGGGGDGYKLAKASLAALRGPLAQKPLSATIVTGPLMSASKRRRLEDQSRSDSRIALLDRTENMHRHVASADLIVCMGGYNTIYESLSQRKRLLVFPRVRPREEQLERATRLQALGLLGVLTQQDLGEPDRLAHRMEAALAAAPPDPAASGLRFDGGTRVARRIMDCLNERNSATIPAMI